MNDPPLDFPSREEGSRLHARLESDATASADICRAYLQPLIDWLADQFRRVDPHLCQTAAEDALVGYFGRPQAYDPGDYDLAAYLRMAARGDLLNLLRAEKRHHCKRLLWSAVEDGREGGNIPGREDEAPLRLERDEERERAQAFLRSAAAGFNEEEKRVLELMLQGERRTAAYAAALGIGGLPVPEQERAVKRAKDRIKKRLERGGVKHG